MRKDIKVPIIALLSLFAAAGEGRASDSKEIGVQIKVIPVSTLEINESAVVKEAILGRKSGKPSDLLIRTTTVDGQTYQEVIPLNNEKRRP